jgi:hypothetical protein
VYENLGYLAKEIVQEALIRGASGVACDLVGAGEREEGVCTASGDVAMEGEVEGVVWAA